MTRLTRLLVSAPLAVLVAFFAHLAQFGTAHAFGGPHGSELLSAALASLGLVLVVAPLAQGIRAPQEAPAPAGGMLPLLLHLALGGAAVYLGMEWIEGHVPALVSTAWAALGISALVVAVAARFAAAGLAWVGHALAAVGRELSAGHPPALQLVRVATPSARARFVLGARRGRAPPDRG